MPFHVKLPLFEIEVKRAKWTVEEGIDHLARYRLASETFADEVTLEAELDRVRTAYRFLVLDALKQRAFSTNGVIIPATQNDLGLSETYYLQGEMDTKSFLEWATTKDLQMPPEFRNQLPVQQLAPTGNDGTSEEGPQEKSIAARLRHYGMLKQQIGKMERTVEATAAVLRYLGVQPLKMTNQDFFLLVNTLKYSDLPEANLTMIWKAIPEEFKIGPGNRTPRKKQ